MKLLLKSLCAFMLMISVAVAQQDVKLDPENTIYLDLKDGRVVIKMLPKVAPKTVARIKELVRQGFYDGLVWHRVIPGFMAQGGDPDGNGQGGSGKNLEAEFSDLMHFRGMVSMARADAENSADSQFFICLGFADHLDGKYTIWGEVVDGMVFVDNIKEGVAPAMTDPDKIVKMQIMADVVKK